MQQVSEKESVQLKGVNLTGANCTQETCNAILQGKYTFVYVVFPFLYWPDNLLNKLTQPFGCSTWG